MTTLTPENTAKPVAFWAGGLVTKAKTNFGEHEVAFEVKSHELANSVVSTRIHGLDMVYQTMLVNGNKSQFLVVRSKFKRYESQFEVLANQVIAVLGQREDLEGSASEVIEAFQDWVEFLKKGPQKTRAEAIQGLIGELLVIRDLLDPKSYDPSQWVGPEGEAQDFRGDDVWLEVKTLGKRKGPTVHTISSLEQLNAPSNRSLYVISYRVILSKTGPNSVLRFISDLKELPQFSTASSRQKLENALAEAGIDESLPPELSNFEYLDPQFYKIEDEFPRVRKSDLPEDTRLFDFTYKVDFTGMQDFLVNKPFDKLVL